jgi:hypothetical protein
MSRFDNISRRSVIAGGAGVLLGSRLLGFQGSEPTGAQVVSGSDRRVILVQYSSSSFASLLEQNFPGVSGNGHFQSLAPLSAIVRLESGPPIRAYSVSWSVNTPTGVYEAARFHYYPADTRRSDSQGRTIASAQRTILGTGETALVTPFTAWSSSLYQKNQSIVWNNLDSSLEPGNFLLQQVSAGSTVQVKLDGAVFSDRKMVGADKHLLGLRLRERRNAEHDVARRALQAVRAGGSVQSVSDLLYKWGTVSYSGAGGAPARYRNSRKHHAQVLLKLMNRVGMDSFTSSLEAMTQMHRSSFPNITTSAS